MTTHGVPTEFFSLWLKYVHSMIARRSQNTAALLNQVLQISRYKNIVKVSLDLVLKATQVKIFQVHLQRMKRGQLLPI